MTIEQAFVAAVEREIDDRVRDESAGLPSTPAGRLAYVEDMVKRRILTRKQGRMLLAGGR